MNKDKIETNIYIIIGRNIQRIRKSQNLTGQDLASLCHLSYGFIKNLEAKSVHASVSIETLKLIADKLGVSIVEFFNTDEIVL